MAEKKRFYLTTAIAYTSGKPHIGNTYEAVLADSIVRFKRQQGYDVFFHGIALGQTAEITLTEGMTMVITLDDVSAPNGEGMRDLTFTINGNRRVISVKDKQALTTSVMAGSVIQFASEDAPDEIGANIPGTIVKVIAKAGDEVKKGEPIAVIEAMKMESNVLALRDGVIEKMYVKEADSVKSGQLIATLETLANDEE